MDKAHAWCLDIEELYNKPEVHSINNSKGDTADVGIFSDNSQVKVFEFLESRKSKPVSGNRKEKFVFYSAITRAIQRLERLS